MIAAAQDAAVATSMQEHPKPNTFDGIKDAREARDKLNEGCDRNDKDKKAIVFAYNTCKKFTGRHLEKELRNRSSKDVRRDRRNVYAYYVATMDEMLQYAHQELMKGKGFSLYEYIHKDNCCVPLFDIENDIKGGFTISATVNIDK